MYWSRARALLLRILPISLFVLGCFPSRGLYFLLHSTAPGGHYFTHQAVLDSPTNTTLQLRAAKMPLPTRLTRVPRSLKKSPFVPAPSLNPALALIPDRQAFEFVPVLPDSVLPQTRPSSPPPGRAPPASV